MPRPAEEIEESSAEGERRMSGNGGRALVAGFPRPGPVASNLKYRSLLGSENGSDDHRRHRAIHRTNRSGDVRGRGVTVVALCQRLSSNKESTFPKPG